jgi:hypothetical protein
MVESLASGLAALGPDAPRMLRPGLGARPRLLPSLSAR